MFFEQSVTKDLVSLHSREDLNYLPYHDELLHKIYLNPKLAAPIPKCCDETLFAEDWQNWVNTSEYRTKYNGYRRRPLTADNFDPIFDEVIYQDSELRRNYF